MDQHTDIRNLSAVLGRALVETYLEEISIKLQVDRKYEI